MDWTHFAALPVIGGHIHFPHPKLVDDVLKVMETVGLVEGKPRANFERVFGAAPAPLNHEAALVELGWMAGVLDAQASAPVENLARRVARELAASLGG